MKKLFSIFCLFLGLLASHAGTVTWNFNNVGSAAVGIGHGYIFSNGVPYAGWNPFGAFSGTASGATSTQNNTTFTGSKFTLALSYDDGSGTIVTNPPVPFQLNTVNTFIIYGHGTTNTSATFAATVTDNQNVPVFAYWKLDDMVVNTATLLPGASSTYTFTYDPAIDRFSYGYNIATPVLSSDGNGGFTLGNIAQNNDGGFTAGGDSVQNPLQTPLNQTPSPTVQNNGPILFSSAQQTNIDMAGFNMLAAQNQDLLDLNAMSVNLLGAISNSDTLGANSLSNLFVSGTGGGGSTNIAGTNVNVLNFPTNYPDTLAGTALTNIESWGGLVSLMTNAISMIANLGAGVDTNDTEPDYTNVSSIFTSTNYDQALSQSASASSDLSTYESEMTEWIAGITGPTISPGDIPDMTIDMGRGGIVDFNPMHSVFAGIFTMVRNFLMWILALFYLERVLVHTLKLVQIMNTARGVTTQAVTTTTRTPV